MKILLYEDDLHIIIDDYRYFYYSLSNLKWARFIRASTLQYNSNHGILI